jgi:hypothetical protein
VMSDDIETCRAILGARERLDIMAINKAGKTPIDIAQEHFADDIIEAFVQAGAKPPDSAGSEVLRPPLVSEDARFLTFADVPEPTDWLRNHITELRKKRDVRVPTESMSLRWAPLDFWPGGFLLAIRNTRRRGPSEQFALVWPNQELVLLNWENERIYEAAGRRAPLFDDARAIMWCRFFLHFVRGALGRFRIVEGIEGIPWAQSPDSAKEREVGQLLEQVRVIERPLPDRIILSATVVFKNALFKSKILLATCKTEIEEEDEDQPESFSRGQLKLFDEELLLEDQPFRDPGPPTRFG